jgi:ABC-type Co2+ transport system permease subunit
MTEIRGFLNWQFAQIRKAKFTEWSYFLAVALGIWAGVTPTSTTVVFGIPLDIWVLGISMTYLLGYLLAMIVSWQYASYQREKELIARELGQK